MKLSIKIIMILAGMTIFCAIYFTQPAYSSPNKNECGILTPQYMCFDKIIKQNDWLICAEIHRNSHGYTPDGRWGKFELGVNVYQNSEQLKQICGEIP